MTENSKPKIIGVVALVLLATGGTAAVIALNKKDAATITTSQTSEAANTTSTSTAASSDAATTANYKDGTYTATGKYISPGGDEQVGLTVTIKDGVVTATSLDTSDATGEAAEYQERFASGYKSLVIGKKIDSISLSRLSGSSLTANGFNDALDTIKEQAQA